MEQPTPGDIKKRLIRLHAELGNFRFFLAHQKGFPAEFEGDVDDAIVLILEEIERETAKMAKIADDRMWDEVVQRSWENWVRGKKPDTP